LHVGFDDVFDVGLLFIILAILVGTTDFFVENGIVGDEEGFEVVFVKSFVGTLVTVGRKEGLFFRIPR